MTALTLKYRPRIWNDVVGQERTTNVLRAMVRNTTNVPPAIILSGIRGGGKTTTARILAAALNCTKPPGNGDPCGECAHCQGVWLTNSTSVLEIDAASNNGIEQIRSLKDLTMYAHEGEWRVILLDEAHSLSKEAFNALLKTLEEPPPHTVFVLLTTEPGKIIDTIRSRSMQFEFTRITTDVIAKRLRTIADAEQIACADEMLAEIARMSRGGMRDAVMMLNQATITGVSEAAQFRAAFGTEECASPIVRAMLCGDLGAVTRLSGEAAARTGDAGALVWEMTELFRDLLVVQAGGKPPCLERALPVRQELARAIPQAAMAPALRVLWAARDRMRGEDDQVTAAQVTCVLVADAMASVAAPRPQPSPRPVPITRPTEPSRMRLEDIRAAIGAS